MASSTTEVDQKSQSPLLSLSRSVDSLLLAYVSSGEEGLKAILNLREVCSTTKTWVDELPLPEAKRIFGKVQVKLNLTQVDVDSENPEEHDQESSLKLIEDFLENPSPAHVTSLSLSGMKFFAAAPLSRNDKKIWHRFVASWWERLEFLEVDYFDNFLLPISSLVNQLLSAPDLNTFHCGQLESIEAAELPLELPQRLFHMEHLQIDSLKLPPFWEIQFSESLSRAPRLKSLKLPIFSESFQRVIANFVVVTKNRVDLAVVFRMDTTATVGGSQELDLSFVSAVAASSASIRIRKLLGRRLRNLKEIAGVQTAKQFFKTVETIHCFKPTSIDDSRLLDFPNLKELSLRNSETETNISLPSSLEDLTISCGWPRSFPRNLTVFITWGYRSSVSELLYSLSSLDQVCPLLNHLQIMWVGDKTLETFNNFCTDVSCFSRQDSPSTTTPFRNLKALYIDLDASFFEDPYARPHANLNGARWILMNGLKLPQLSLKFFEFVFAPNFKNCSAEKSYKAPPVFDRCALSSLIEGKIAKSLQRVLIEDSCVAEDAISLREKLKSLAEENKRKVLPKG